jgi:hypothetical protein
MRGPEKEACAGAHGGAQGGGGPMEGEANLRETERIWPSKTYD